ASAWMNAFAGPWAGSAGHATGPEPAGTTVDPGRASPVMSSAAICQSRPTRVHTSTYVPGFVAPPDRAFTTDSPIAAAQLPSFESQTSRSVRVTPTESRRAWAASSAATLARPLTTWAPG